MLQPDVGQMFFRKLIAAYYTSWAISLWLSLPNIIFDRSTGNAAGSYILFFIVIAMFAAPVIFIYGILVSSLVELAAVKFKRKGSTAVFVSGLLHVLFGLCLGFAIRSMQFIMIGGVAAFLFFIFDVSIVRYILRIKLLMRLLSFAAPIFPLILIVGTLCAISPQEPLFTANAAVQFATSGNGTLIDRFPKEEGQVIKLQIGGYNVERETKVEKTSRKATYNVVFTERWRKGEEIGQYQMVYEVSRGSMEAKRRTGAQPPYWSRT